MQKCSEKNKTQIIQELEDKNKILLAALKNATKNYHDSNCHWYENILENKCNCNLGKLKQKLLLF